MQDEKSPIKDARRNALMDAATELLAIQPTASLSEIASHAGIGKATLHRYFPSRDDLLLALAYRAVALVKAAIEENRPNEGGVEEALLRLVEALVPLGDKIHFLLQEATLDNAPELTQAEQEAQAGLLASLAARQKAGEIRADFSAEWLLHITNYLLYATWNAVHQGFIPRRDAARMMVSTLLYGIIAR